MLITYYMSEPSFISAIFYSNGERYLKTIIAILIRISQKWPHPMFSAGIIVFCIFSETNATLVITLTIEALDQEKILTTF